jgi:hypothetical protein
MLPAAKFEIASVVMSEASGQDLAESRPSTLPPSAPRPLSAE